MSDLSPCKCGSTNLGDEDVHWEIDGYHVRIFCKECYATTSMCPSWAGAVDDWNTRDLAYEGERSLFEEIKEGFNALKENK